MENLNALAVFTRVAEARSFTQAAQRLGLTASAVSKSVRRLEQELGVRLLHRSTRLVSLTNDGVDFYERCRQILAAVDEAQASVSLSKATPQGRLRVQMPVGFGRQVGVPVLRALARAHPRLVIDAELSDRAIDVLYEGFDAAIQIGQVSDERLAALRVGNLRFHALASPEYLARHGEPRVPEDLLQHECLAYAVPVTGRYRRWDFARDGKTWSLDLGGRLNINNAECLLEAALAGEGVVMISNFIAGEAIRSGRLRPVLADFVAPGPDVFLVYPPGPAITAKLRALMDGISAAVAAM